MPDTPNVLTVAQVAELRECSKEAVRLAFKESRLAGHKIGGTILIDAEAARQFTPKHGWPKGKKRKVETEQTPNTL